jgi:hypothetical protein
MAYVYCHFRKDDQIPFYIGMGHTKTRPWNMSKRNRLHKNIANKHGIFVSILIKDIDWETALWWEVRWINALRNAGYNLANLTDGGDGTKGHVPSDEWRRKQSIARKGKKMSDEARKNMSAARKGIKFTEEHKFNLSNSAKKRGAPVLSEESKKKISLSKMGKPRSTETIEKISKSLNGRVAHNKGKPHSEEHKQKLKAAWVRRKARGGAV